MSDKDKIIIVYYVGCAGMHQVDINTYMESWYENTHDLFDDTVKYFYIPNLEAKSTRVEVLNPRYISRNQYKKILRRMEKNISEIEKKIKNI